MHLTTALTNPVSASASNSCAISNVNGLYQIDPLTDQRWPELVSRSSRASIFHSVPWLRALRQTYGYQPIAFTWAAPGGKLDGAALFCEVNSWLTGRRLVSLPFSDHCSLLFDETSQSKEILTILRKRLSTDRFRYIEVRPTDSADMPSSDWVVSSTYTFHRLDLRPDLDVLFRNFHQSSIQRKILRADRERLTYREGSDEDLLDAFYRLLVITRKRHCVPPQPRVWFRNLIENFGGALKIRTAFKGQRAVAGMLTIRHKNALFYKYGGSDARFHNLGGMHLLYWRAIQDAKRDGLSILDFGRSDTNQPGLITFKSRWGATCSTLRYFRFASQGNAVHSFDPASGMKRVAIKHLCSLAPAFLLPTCGRLLYKHIG
jgi:hypothetical protein